MVTQGSSIALTPKGLGSTEPQQEAIWEKEAKWWRDASIAYFQSLSKRPLPAGYAAPEHDLGYYESLCFPYAPGGAPHPNAKCD